MRDTSDNDAVQFLPQRSRLLSFVGLDQFCHNNCVADFDLFDDCSRHMFEVEQVDYEKEQIDWSYITFNDNKARHQRDCSASYI